MGNLFVVLYLTAPLETTSVAIAHFLNCFLSEVKEKEITGEEVSKTCPHHQIAMLNPMIM